MNYSTLGSFDLFENTYRSEYLEGQGRFANNKKLLKEIFDKSEVLANRDVEIEKKRNDIDNWLKNPLNK